MDIQALIEKRAFCEVKYGPVDDQETIELAFAPHRYTQPMHVRTLAIARDPELPTDALLLDLLVDWDITEEKAVGGETVKKTVPITSDNLARLPVMLKVNMLNAIMLEVMNSGKETTYSSSKPGLSLVANSGDARSMSASSETRSGRASRRGN